MKRLSVALIVGLNTIFMLCVLFAFIPKAQAAPPLDIPNDASKIYKTFRDAVLYSTWKQSNGNWYCSVAGRDIFLAEWGQAAHNPGEDLITWFMREKDRLFPGTPTPAQFDICRSLHPVNVWTVPQWRTNNTRPLYNLILISAGVKREVGRVPHGTSCEGPVLHSTTRTTYKKIAGMDGAAVCKIAP